MGLSRILLSFSILISAILGCADNSGSVINGYVRNRNRCKSSGKSVRKISKQNGTTGYHNALKMYVVTFTPEHTIDTFIYAVVCNPPEELKTPGLKIRFDGELMEYLEKVEQYYPGQEYYLLDLRQYKLTP